MERCGRCGRPGRSPRVAARKSAPRSTVSHRLDALGAERGAAAGAERNGISALAASGSVVAALKPAANPILVCNSSEIGPTTSTPGTSDNARRHHHDHVGFAARHDLDAVFRLHRLQLATASRLDAHAVEQADEDRCRWRPCRKGNRLACSSVRLKAATEEMSGLGGPHAPRRRDRTGRNRCAARRRCRP